MRHELVSLLEACKRDPDDAAARLVLADWLEEHGDEDERRRAEFLRLEATSGEVKGRPEFYWLRMRLWHQGRRQWAPYQTALRKSREASHRGGLVGVEATPTALNSPRATRWAGREEWAWVESVSVRPREGELLDVLESPLLKTVPILALYEADLGGADAAALERSVGLASLRELRLVECRASPETMRALCRSRHAAGLQSLAIDRTTLADRSFVALGRAHTLPALERLDLWETVGCCVPAIVSPHRRLGWLRFRHDLSPVEMRNFAESDGCSGLRWLDLGPVTGRNTFEELAKARFWPTLESFRLDRAPITHLAAEALARIPAAPRLRAFNCQLGIEAAVVLDRLATSPLFSELTHLDLRDQPLGPAGVAALTGMPAAPMALDLRGCRIGDEGAATLATWPKMTRCRVLLLARNDLTEAGMAALADSPYLGGLAGLNVVSNPLGDAGIERLTRAPWFGGLEELLLGNCEAGARAVSALIRAAPRMTRLRQSSVGFDSCTDALREAFAHVPYVE